MSREGLELLLLKLGVATAVVTPVTQSLFHYGNRLPFFDVSISTLGMSAAGSMIAFAYGKPVEKRTHLFGYAVGGTFVGVWAVKILPRWLGWDWYIADDMAAPLAGFVALLSRWLIPLAIEFLPAFAKWLGSRAPSGDK